MAGSSILHLWAIAPVRRDHRRALGGAARLREERPGVWRMIEPGELHAVLASASSYDARRTIRSSLLPMVRIVAPGCCRTDAAGARAGRAGSKMPTVGPCRGGGPVAARFR